MYLGTKKVSALLGEGEVYANTFDFPITRLDPNSGSLTMALPLCFFAGSFGMNDVSSDVSGVIKGTNNLNVTWTGSGAYWPTGSFVALPNNGYFESISMTGERNIGFPGDLSGFVFGSEPFTIEFYYNYSALNSFNYAYYHDQSLRITWQQNTSKWRLVFMQNGFANEQVFDSSAISLSANTWYHLALVKSGSNFSLFTNGLRILNSTYNFTMGGTSAYPVRIFHDHGTVTERYQDYRVYKGVATYPVNAATSYTPSGSIVINNFI